MLVGRSLVEGGRGKVSTEMFNPSEEEVTLNRNTHSTLVHAVEVKEDQEEQKRTSGECIARKGPQEETCPKRTTDVCEETQFDLTKEE